MSQGSQTNRMRRLNFRHAIVLGALLLAAIPGLFALKAYQDRHGRTRMLEEAKKRLESQAATPRPRLPEPLPRAEPERPRRPRPEGEGPRRERPERVPGAGGDPGPQPGARPRPRQPEAPGDPPAADRAEPQGPGPVEGGRGAGPRPDPTRAPATPGPIACWPRPSNRARAEGDAKALEEAGREYETAERLEPGDVEGAERLARLYREQAQRAGQGPAGARPARRPEQGRPRKLAAAHLARARYFNAQSETDRADAEIERAMKADPGNLDVRLMAAEAATHRGDTARPGSTSRPSPRPPATTCGSSSSRA